ncbi:hypothetical protein BBJ28_00002227 [Nothophytophthora sp. Chile5]|nr:hypothetical protein BBJ28_00002227 [Nothophytophthora sp. Chile5]
MAKARVPSRVQSPFLSDEASPMEGGAAWTPQGRGSPAPAPALTASERAYMIRKAKEASVALVDHAHTLDGPVQWHYTGKFRGIQMYRGEGSFENASTAGTEFLCGVTTMLGSIEEVAWHFDQQTTEQMRDKKAEDVLDCAVLYSLVQGDSTNPFYRVSAKYQSYEGPSAFSRPRDYCYLECQDTFRHASGRRGWVLSMHSIKLPSCPDVEGVVRGSMYHSGYVFVEAEKEGYMDVMHSLQINFKSTSRLPHFLLNSALKRRILSVVTISREIQSARLGHQTLLQKKDLMPKRARALCVICSRKFSLFVRKTRCRVCGEVACQPCAPQVEVTAPGQPPRKTRICVKCYHSSPSDEFEDVAKLREDPTDARRQQNETRYSDILQEQGETFIELDEDEQDADEDGLEEQSSCSVFAQSRFTQASRDSVVTASPFDVGEEVNMDERLSDGSSAYWKESSGASSMLGWNQASSVKHVDGIYDPQASSNFYGASNYSIEENDKPARRNNSTAPIPEDVPPVNTTNKTLSIQEIVKARSARYGIVSRFPPPPPPSPPHEVAVKASLDAGALKAHNMRYSKSQAAKNKSITSSRKMFTPPIEEHDENDSPNHANAVPKVPRKNTFKATATVAKTEEGARVSHIESGVFGGTRSSAILNQVRINRSRTIQFTPEGDYRSSAMLKAIEEEHLNRMREIERMQALAKQQAARRSMASNGSRRSSQFKVQPTKSSVGSDRDAVEAAGVVVAKPRRSSPQSPPGSPPGTPPRVQARAPPRTPPHSPPRRSSVMSKQRTSRGVGDRPRRTETINEERPSNSPRQIQFLSTRSNDTFSDVRASVPPSEHLEDLTFNTQRSGFHVSVGPVTPEDLSFEEPRPDTPPRVSLPPSEPSENLGFDASQISILARSKLSTSIAILETPADAARKSALVMMERPSTPRESTASMMFDEDLVNRPTEDLYEQIHANRARKAQQLPEEDFRSSEAMRTMESEHRKRMEELNRIAVDQIGARISRLDDLRDSSTDSEDLEYRPLGRSKRSGTILFTPEIIERSTEVMETMEGEHKSRMEELNQLALDHTGDRISKLVADDDDVPFGDFQPHSSRLVDGEGGSAVDEFYADSSRVIPGSESSSAEHVQADTSSDSAMAHRTSRDSTEFEQENLEFIPCIDEEHTTDEYYPTKEQNSNSTSSTEASERVSTPRESCVSAFDEDLMNRPTNDIFEQVRANRNGKHVPVYTVESTGGVRSSEMMHSIEASHKQRMEELNQIAVDHLGNRISSLDDVSVSAYRPVRELYDTEEEEEMQWRSTDIMEQYENDHEQEMETLRRKIRQLEEECRESIASVLTPEEMDFSDLSDEPPAPSPKIKSKKTKSLERKSSYKSSKIIRTTHLNHLPPQFADPVSPQVLYEQIAQLTKLQRQMALAKDDADEEEFRARIKAQYRLLRSIQVQNRR